MINPKQYQIFKKLNFQNKICVNQCKSVSKGKLKKQSQFERQNTEYRRQNTEEKIKNKANLPQKG